MDAQNNPAENAPDASRPPAIRQPTDSTAYPQSLRDSVAGGQAGPAASDKSAAQWRLILLVLCAVGAGLVIGILALQVTEYLFYKAPPNVWPQPGAADTFSAPVTLNTPLSPVTNATSSAAPVADSVPVSPTGQASAPAIASVSASVPNAAKP